MRVSQSNSTPVQNSETTGAKKADRAARQGASDEAKRSNSATTILGSTKTEISPQARDLAKAKAVATAAPDVREQKIAELKRRIAEGSYKVDSKAVADKLVDDHVEIAKREAKTADLG